MKYIVYYWINDVPTNRIFDTWNDASLFASGLVAGGVENHDILIKKYDGYKTYGLTNEPRGLKG